VLGYESGPQPGGGRKRSFRGCGMMKNGRSKGSDGISYGSEIVGQKALTWSLCLDIQPLDSPSLLLAHVNTMQDDFEIVLPCSSLLVSLADVD
jgi:hypothetical protein